MERRRASVYVDYLLMHINNMDDCYNHHHLSCILDQTEVSQQNENHSPIDCITNP